ncbi:MAG: PQQ-binding-like beta-propeller repeat protein [Lentisphaeria bacterium]|nr:PQQ-binding-like beta-propeller repeat protein [Lentisphaeria bacterium]
MQFRPSRLALAIVVSLIARSSHAKDERYWERFPLPPGNSRGIQQAGIDAKNGLWIMAGSACYYWDTDKRDWQTTPLRSSAMHGKLAAFHGTAQTGLYAIQRGKERHRGDVYRLLTGKVEKVTTFNYTQRHPEIGFHVSRNGRLFNWCDGILRVWAHGAWKEWQVDIAQRGVLVFDQGKNVSLYRAGVLYTVDEQGKTARIDLGDKIGRKATRGALWGRNRAIVLDPNMRKLWGFNPRTGESIELPPPMRAPRGTNIRDLVSLPDGTVLVLAKNYGLRCNALQRLAVDGSMQWLKETASLPLGNSLFSNQSTGILLATDGTLWLAGRDPDVLCLRSGKIHQFDQRVDLSPFRTTQVATDATGVVYTAGDDHLYAYNLGTSLTGLPRPKARRISSPGREQWRVVQKPHVALKRLARVGDLALLCPDASRNQFRVQAVDLGNGKERFSLPMTRGDWLRFTAGPGNGPGEATLHLKDRLHVLSATTGETLRTVSFPNGNPRRPRPLALAGGRFLLSHHNERFSCVAGNGNEIWRLGKEELGQVLLPPVAGANVIVVETIWPDMSRSYVSGIDANSGALLWSESVDGLGQGIALADDASHFVMATTGDSAQAPEGSDGHREISISIGEAGAVTTTKWVGTHTPEGRLTCRDSRTGKILWVHRQQGVPPAGPPVIDHAAGRIFSYARDGSVLCLDGKSGKLLWRTMLPQPPLDWHSLLFMRPHHASSGAGILLATDRAKILSVLNAATGEVHECIQLVEDVRSHGLRVGRERLLTAPWLVKDHLILHIGNELRAYEFPTEAYDSTAQPL